MKKQFQKEEHNRLDKALKNDYIEEIHSRHPTNDSWSGLNNQEMQVRCDIRKEQIKKFETYYFIYGKWLYQNTRKLKHFTRLNACHASPGDPGLEVAFNQCREKWNKDFKKIANSIKNAQFVKPNGFARKIRGLKVLDWKLPDDIIADEVWDQFPPQFKKEPEKTVNIGDAPPLDENCNNEPSAAPSTIS